LEIMLMGRTWEFILSIFPLNWGVSNYSKADFFYSLFLMENHTKFVRKFYMFSNCFPFLITIYGPSQ
jgi:hypothetical protein